LHDKEQILGVMTISVKLTHSEGLMPAIDSLLQQTRISQQDLSAIACVVGPGSYTGLRVGIATGQGLALNQNLPCVGLSSFDVLSWAFPYTPHLFCPLLPARKGWLYARIYEWLGDAPTPVTEELYIEPDELIKYVNRPILFYGPGLAPYATELHDMLGDEYLSVGNSFELPRADLLAELAYRKIKHGDSIAPEAMLPHYLGPSQAEVNWKQRQKQPS
jgi:tRNA threonylcarbamoyladenosine biosynthesis protein TsaB